MRRFHYRKFIGLMLVISWILLQRYCPCRIFYINFYLWYSKILIDPFRECSSIINPVKSIPGFFNAYIIIQNSCHRACAIVISCQVEETMAFHSKLQPSFHLNRIYCISLPLSTKSTGRIWFYCIIITRCSLRGISAVISIISSIQIYKPNWIGSPLTNHIYISFSLVKATNLRFAFCIP